MKKFIFGIALIINLSLLSAQSLQLIVPTGHTRRVSDFTVSKNLQWLASADGSNVVKIWDFIERKELFHLNHEGKVSALIYDSNGYLITASSDGKLYYWDEAGQLAHELDIKEGSIVQLQADSSYVYAVTSHKVFQIKSHVVAQDFKVKTEAITVAKLVSGRMILGHQSGEVTILDLSNGKQKSVAVSDKRIGTIESDLSNIYVGTDGGQLIKLNEESLVFESVDAFSLRNYNMALMSSNSIILACGRDSKENLKAFSTSSLKPTGAPFRISIDEDHEAFRFGLRALKSVNDSLVLIADYFQKIRVYNLNERQWKAPFEGKATSINDLSVDRTGNWLAIAGSDEAIKVLDLTNTKSDRILAGSAYGSRAIDFHPVNPVVAVYGLDEKVRVINTINGDEIFQLKAKGEYSSTPITFDPTGRYILRKSDDSDFDLYNFRKNTPKNLKVKDGRKYVFSNDGKQLFFSTKNGLIAYSAVSHEQLAEIPLPNIQDVFITSDNELGVLMRDDQTVKLYTNDLKLIREVSITTEANSDEIYPASNGYWIGVKNSIARGAVADFSIKVIDSQTGELVKKLSGHAGFVNDVEFVNQKMLTSAIDGEIKIWDINETHTQLGSIIPMDSDQYVITTPKGLFDATPIAMSQLHYVKAGKIISLEQMKSTYYEPNLLSKILGLNKEKVREAQDLSEVNLYPEMELIHPLKNDGRLGINLNSNGGGIGRVVILINGKEVSSDVRDVTTPNARSMEINYDVTNHPYLYDDQVSKVTIMAYNSDGTLSSEAKSMYLFAQNRDQVKPKLFAIIAGSSDYEGDDLDLKFAAKDATDLASAIRISASSYLGAENTNITLLTTDQAEDKWPTKANIKAAFDNYASQASASDLLLVYLSGHGVNHGGENSDFYYLTCTTKDGDMNNTVSRENDAISSNEFTSYIKSVPALKQILIVDACHSGRLASSLVSSRSATSSTQIRALERMKDRTGMFVLAGSAADAVSYETTLYGQGLLTYSLLFGMKGAALREDGFVDVMELFQFAANKVPEMAEEIGGIQKPEIRMPQEAKSFDIGRLTAADREMIAIKAPKPVFVNSRFQDESAIYDQLDLSELMNEKLSEVSKEKDAPIVYVDDNKFGDGIMINGRYSIHENLIKAQIIVIQNNIELTRFDIEAINENLLTEAVLEKVLTIK